MNRIEGQVRGIEGMVDDVALGLLDGHARHCVVDGHAQARPTSSPRS